MKRPRSRDLRMCWPVTFASVQCDAIRATRAELGRSLEAHEGAETRNQDDADAGVARGLDLRPR
ncbi:hypothetical protein LP414_32225 [Polaromonas sp. P1(28)-13]|nr:hypothetical protein LP414_32225 [Polaromonas sp. P1(28)-13]